MDVTPNRPEVVAEVADLFERYEQALIDKDVAVLDATFWDSPNTVRYALRDNGYGFDAIHASRVAAPKMPGGSKEARIRLEILTLGRLSAEERHGSRQGRVEPTRTRLFESRSGPERGSSPQSSLPAAGQDARLSPQVPTCPSTVRKGSDIQWLSPLLAFLAGASVVQGSRRWSRGPDAA